MLLVTAALAMVSCGRTADVASHVNVQLVDTGWHDAGHVSGRNKVVPTASVKITNVSDRNLPAVQVNAVFHRNGDSGTWGTAFVAASGSSGMTPGSGTTVTLRSDRGYTGEDPQETMLTNRQFVDVTVDVFAKYGSQQWTRVGAFPIDRRLVQ